MEKYVTNIKDLVIQALENDSEIKAKAERNDALSCFLMGMIHLLGIETPIDFKKASSFLGNQSLKDNPDANRLLGFIAECEGNFSLAFKSYANAIETTDSNAKKPYTNKVFTERNNLQAYFKKLELPNTALNKEITKFLNDYVKGGESKVDASIKLAMICDDEDSCMDAAQALFDDGDYHSSMRWIQYGNIPENNSLYVLVKEKISGSKNKLNLPNTLEVFEFDGNSLLTNFNVSSPYEGVVHLCNEMAVSCKKEWKVAVSPKVATIMNELKEEEAARIKKLKEEEAARLRKLKEEEDRLLRLKLAEEKERKNKQTQRTVDVILLSFFGLFELLIITAFVTNKEDTVLYNFTAIIGMSTIFVVLPFLVLRWVIKKLIKLNK